MTDRAQVERHYASDGITGRVLTALRNVNGPDVEITPDTLAPIDHFHGRGVAATEELAALLQPKRAITCSISVAALPVPPDGSPRDMAVTSLEWT